MGMDPVVAMMGTMHLKSQNDSYLVWVIGRMVACNGTECGVRRLFGAASVAGFEDVAKQPTTSSVRHRLRWVV